MKTPAHNNFDLYFESNLCAREKIENSVPSLSFSPRGGAAINKSI